MNYVSISPTINGITYYLLFGATYYENSTTFVLEKDYQSDLLMDFLPVGVHIYISKEAGFVKYDDRIYTVEGKELSMIFFRDLLKVKKPEAPPVKLWWQK
ncbi:hypothetical protein CLV51_11023 [Chitinophaga niastensis]|uniref:Uncharacterized protein n=2 Tax=Chitinophaga niastensis TaxID=536980 RepID=A0A2P8H997_CHINA|nr:hypothetical protein CLV51_11023 [Chitinophaga niastensis]